MTMYSLRFLDLSRTVAAFGPVYEKVKYAPNNKIEFRGWEFFKWQRERERVISDEKILTNNKEVKVKIDV